MPERLSPEEARTVPLSRNPLRRLGQLAEYGAGFHTRRVGGILPDVLTRGELVRMAVAAEEADAMLGRIKGTAEEQSERD